MERDQTPSLRCATVGAQGADTITDFTGLAGGDVISVDPDSGQPIRLTSCW